MRKKAILLQARGSCFLSSRHNYRVVTKAFYFFLIIFTQKKIVFLLLLFFLTQKYKYQLIKKESRNFFFLNVRIKLFKTTLFELATYFTVVSSYVVFIHLICQISCIFLNYMHKSRWSKHGGTSLLRLAYDNLVITKLNVPIPIFYDLYKEHKRSSSSFKYPYTF